MGKAHKCLKWKVLRPPHLLEQIFSDIFKKFRLLVEISCILCDNNNFLLFIPGNGMLMEFSQAIMVGLWEDSF